MAELEDVADDLYGGPPAEFVARRDAAVKAARADGDRALAREIGGLRRPTVSAWLVNLLMRDDPDLGTQVLSLGEGLRDAERSLDGPALRELTAQRRALVRSLVDRARRLARPTGQRISDVVAQELDATLTAALADPAIAADVVAGRLTEARSWSGFGSAGADEPERPHLRLVGADDRSADGAATQASSSAGRRRGGNRPPDANAQRETTEQRRATERHEASVRRARAEAQEAWEQADRQVQDAEDRHAAAARERDANAAALARAEQTASAAHETEDELVRELGEVRHRLAAAGEAASAADHEVSGAQRSLREGERGVAAGERELHRAERAREAAAAARDLLADGG